MQYFVENGEEANVLPEAKPTLPNPEKILPNFWVWRILSLCWHNTQACLSTPFYHPFLWDKKWSQCWKVVPCSCSKGLEDQEFGLCFGFSHAQFRLKLKDYIPTDLCWSYATNSKFLAKLLSITCDCFLMLKTLHST